MSRPLAMFFGAILFVAIFSPDPGEQGDEAKVTADGRSAATPSRSTRLAADSMRERNAYSADSTVLGRDSSGQFRLTAQVNGMPTRFLVDTGADIVAITVEDAAAMGIELSQDEFRPIARTASGVGYGAPVMLERIEIGDAEFRDVEAMVIDGLGTNLLGQSVLRRLRKVELQGDRMVLRH